MAACKLSTLLQFVCIVVVIISNVSCDFHGGDSRKSDQVFYIAAVEIEWDYAPSGVSQVKSNDSNAEFYIRRSSDRIGSKYKKAVFREFTDETFTKQKPHPDYLGVVGPTLWTEIHQKITIHFKNMASRTYSLNVHGSLLKDESKTIYNTKQYEGALYDDGTQGLFKMDDGVPPGGEWRYIYKLHYRDGPAIYDDTCAPRIYQSHVDAVRDVESGLVGVIMVCRERNKGDSSFRQFGRMRDRRHLFDKNFTLLWKIFDENLSWYLDDNIKKYADNSLINKRDEVFRQSNRMHAVNGYVFGNMPVLNVCRGDYVGWFVTSYGSKFNVHSVKFHGHNLVYHDKRAGMLDVYPLQSVSSRMHAVNPGKWMMRCAMHEHYEAGMQAFFTVKECDSQNFTKSDVSGFVEREYFIAAEEEEWDYGPSGYDQLTGRKLTQAGTRASQYFSREDGNLGGQYKKARYVEYTDATFSVKKQRDDSEKHLGLLGPIIKASYNNKIKVVFKNLASRAYSIHAEGVLYDKANEGMLYNDGTSGAEKADDSVPPGGTHVYNWYVPYKTHYIGYSQMCLSWMYHSGVDPVRDIHSGLVGAILICNNNKLDHVTNKQIGKDNEFYLHFNVMDETRSWYIDENIQRYSNDPSSVQKSSPRFKQANLKHNINGYMYANIPMIKMGCKTERNAFHLLSTGGENDLFTVQFYGENLRERSMNRLKMTLQPGLSRTLQMTPYNEGIWPIKAGKFSFCEAGMSARYQISNCSNVNETLIVNKVYNRYRNVTTYERTFYIAAVELEWDFAPRDHHIITGERLSIPSSPGYKYLTHTNGRLGSKYKKAVYREYEDETFTKMKKRSAKEMHLGLLGPVIKGGAGDTIKVVFKNLATRKYSIHPDGIIVNKENDGERYEDGTSGDSKVDDAVAPGDVQRYEWFLPRWSTPTSGFGLKCGIFVYHSAVDPTRDVHSGLVGPLYVCPDELLDVNLTRSWPTGGNDYEYFLLFAMFDENLSWYFDANVQQFSENPSLVNKSDPEFIASNRMHAINGYIFGTMPPLRQSMMTWTDFHLMSVGTQQDIHVPHISNMILETEAIDGSERRMDGVPLYPGASIMVYDHKIGIMTPGNWLIRCAINEHFQAGMMAMWEVTNPFQDMIDLLNKKRSWWDRLSGIKKAGLVISLLSLFFGILGCARRIYKRRRLEQRRQQRQDQYETPNTAGASIPMTEGSPPANV